MIEWTRTRLMLVLLLVSTATVGLQPQAPSAHPRNFVRINDRVIALTNVRVIDGTGAPARERQTIVVSGGRIAAMGDTGSTTPPADARIFDLTGRSIMPGLVMLHEHLYYPTSANLDAPMDESFVRLYLAAGVTTIRTAGTFNGVMDVRYAKAIEAGAVAGPAIDVTAPYLNGPVSSPSMQMSQLADAADARRQVAYWAEMGATSFKAYTSITRAELAAAIDEVHRRGLKITGHLCSVTYAEAIDLGIDNLEHGFAVATDFVSNKRPDACPARNAGERAIAALDPGGAPFQALVKKLVDRGVTLTSTLPVLESYTPGRPMPRALDVLLPDLRERVEAIHAQVSQDRTSLDASLFPKEMALERAFARAGGMLVAGTDPTGYGGVIPGAGNIREIELLVEAGFTPVEAIRIATLNGAQYLGRDGQIGSLAAGKQADMVVVTGDPSTNIAAAGNVETVFKKGVGYSPVRLVDSVRGRVGLW